MLSRRANSDQIAFNFTSYYGAFSNLFMGFAAHCIRYAEYEICCGCGREVNW